MSGAFYTLRIAEVVDETDEARSIRFAIPEELREAFKFKPGQHLTLKAEIAGEEVRRNYSLCVAPHENELRIAIKRIGGGAFSNWANEALKPGSSIEVMVPHGSFTWKFDPVVARNYVGFAGGSGRLAVVPDPVLERERGLHRTGSRDPATRVFRPRDTCVVWLHGSCPESSSRMT